MIAVPTPYRFLILGLFVVTMLLWDLRHPPHKRYRWQEYPFIIGVGTVGAIIGVANDLITSQLSPEYFLYFKGIPTEQFLWHVILLGSQAGFAAGTVGSGMLLLCSPMAPHHPNRIKRLLPLVKWPFVGAIATGILSGMLSHHLNWPQSFGDFHGVLNPSQFHWLHTVWMIHIGLYGGAIAGLVIVIVRLRHRKTKR